MATQETKFNITLNSIRCIDEADSWGLGKPYLWMMAFKIGGDEIRQIKGNPLKIEGSPVYSFGQGSHGNIGGGMDAGEVRLIPGTVGSFGSSIRPIEIDLLDNRVEIPGFIGLVTILMEEANLSDKEAEAGHQVLNLLVMEKINAFLSRLNLLDIYLEASGLSDSTFPIEKAFTSILKSKLEKAMYQLAADKEREIKRAISIGQKSVKKPWSWMGNDVLAGSTMSLFSTEATTGQQNGIEFKANFNGGDGEYEVNGKFSLSKPKVTVGLLDSATDRLGGKAIARI